MSDFMRGVSNEFLKGQANLDAIRQPQMPDLSGADAALQEMNESREKRREQQDAARDATLEATMELAKQVRLLNAREQAGQRLEAQRDKRNHALAIAGICVGALTLFAAILVPILVAQ